MATMYISKITPLGSSTTYNIKDLEAIQSIATGDSNGQIKITPRSGNAYNVNVKGLGSNAYTSTAYLPLTGGTMTGPITFVGNQSSAFNDKGIIFTNGSRIGENSSKALGLYSGSTFYIRPDSATSSSGKGIEISSTTMYPTVNNEMSLGDSSHKWTTVYATTFSGNATSATGFASAKSIALTGDITGSATGGNGSNNWSIATTIGTGKVTNAMLAGSIANSKLVNSKVTIAGNDVSLGGALTADTLRSSLGLSNAMHFKGTTTTTLTDGTTTAAVTIGGSSYTPEAGDVVLYSDSEFVWTGSAWERLGRDSSFKVTQTAYTDSTGTAEATTATRFVYSVSQDANGVVSFKTRPLPTYNNYSLPLAASGTRGGIQIGYSESGTNYAVKLSSEKAYVTVPWTDTKVTSVGNHYTPEANSDSELTAALSGTAGAYAVNTEYTVLTGVKAQRDAKGHITGLTYTAQKIKDTNTTYTFDGTYNASTNKAATVSTVTNAINALDVSNISGFGVGKTLKTLTETDGKIAATFQDISITKSQVTDFPTDVSAFINDAGYLTSFTETDPTVPAWAKASSKPSYTASEVGLGNVTNAAQITKSTFTKAYQVMYSTAANTPAVLDANTTTTKKFLRMTGTGSAGAAPAWDTVTKSDVGLGNVENTKLSTWAGSSNITTIGTLSSGTVPWARLSNVPSSFTPSSHTHNLLVTEGDNRTVVTTPNDYSNKIIFRGLKTNSSFNSPSTDTYSYVIGLRGWSDSSGGDSHELAFNNTGLYWRHGATTSWGNWARIYTTANKPTKSDIGLGNVENTALSTWAGSSNITTIGTLSSGTVPWARLSNVPSSFVPASHTHGNLTNDGKISTTATIANGDKLVIVDSDTTAASKITGSSITFGTSTTTFLSNKGTWETPAGTYSLPLAASGTRGGIQIGYSESGSNYAVKLSSEKAYVTVPWTDTKVTQNNTTAANDYRVLLSTSANDTAETNTINKNTNLRYNPSTNTLSTGNISGSGNLTITGNTNLNGETYTESITAGSLLVNGNANFVQIPTAPTPAATSNDTSVATTAFVTSALTGVSSPMRFIGSLGTGGTATSLPAASAANQGYTYKVITANTYQGVAAKVGDVLVSNGSSWILIPSGDEPSGTVTSITLKAGNGITLDTDNTAITSSGTRTISHKDTSSVSNLTANGRTYVTGLTFDTYGHVTAYTTGTETVTNSDTKNTAGSTDTTSKIFLIGATSQAANPQTYSDSEIYVQNGTLYAVKAQDLSGTANNKPALIVGGTDTAAHMELDSNEIQAKTNGTSVAQLYINNDGGLVTVGSGGLAITSLTASQAVSTDANKKLVSTNLTVSDPTASGTGITYIATISQGATGKITATKSTVRSASTSQTGVTQYTADNLNTWINQLGTGSSTPVDADYYISQYVGGGTTTTTYHRRPMSALWEYIKGKITAGTYWANIKISDAAKYNAAPEMATIKLNGNTSATAASTSNVTLVYDTTSQALNFVFA